MLDGDALMETAEKLLLFFYTVIAMELWANEVHE